MFKNLPWERWLGENSFLGEQVFVVGLLIRENSIEDGGGKAEGEGSMWGEMPQTEEFGQGEMGNGAGIERKGICGW